MLDKYNNSIPVFKRYIVLYTVYKKNLTNNHKPCLPKYSSTKQQEKKNQVHTPVYPPI